MKIITFLIMFVFYCSTVYAQSVFDLSNEIKIKKYEKAKEDNYINQTFCKSLSTKEFNLQSALSLIGASNGLRKLYGDLSIKIKDLGLEDIILTQNLDYSIFLLNLNNYLLITDYDERLKLFVLLNSRCYEKEESALINSLVIYTTHKKEIQTLSFVRLLFDNAIHNHAANQFNTQVKYCSFTINFIRAIALSDFASINKIIFENSSFANNVIYNLKKICEKEK